MSSASVNAQTKAAEGIEIFFGEKTFCTMNNQKEHEFSIEREISEVFGIERSKVVNLPACKGH